MRNARLVLSAVVATGLAACSTILLGPDFEDEFVTVGSCADVFFFAVDSVDQVMLTFSVQGLVAQARAASDTVTTTYDLPDGDVTLIVEQGSRISDAMCDDVIENGGPRVSRTWQAVAGRATVTIRPGEDMFDNRGDLVLEDVVFEDDEGHRRTVESLTWIDSSVGWFPG